MTNHTMGEQLHYTYHGSEDLVYNLLTAFGKLQYTAHQLGLAHLQFELHAEPPTLYDLVYLAVDNIPGDQIWRKMRYDDMMSERRLYLCGDFVALKEHTEPFGATLKLGVVDAFGTIINPHAFDEWLCKVTPPKLGSDSAMEVGLYD